MWESARFDLLNNPIGWLTSSMHSIIVQIFHGTSITNEISGDSIAMIITSFAFRFLLFTDNWTIKLKQHGGIKSLNSAETEGVELNLINDVIIPCTDNFATRVEACLKFLRLHGTESS